LHRARGVDVRSGVAMKEFRGHPAVVGATAEVLDLAEVELTDGTVVAADVALVAIGGVPEVEWLLGTSVTVDNGVVCDAFCRAASGIWAAGDIARWSHVGLGRDVRFEHRMNAAEQGRAVALDILGAGVPFSPVPYFWTDQYGIKIQMCGSVPLGDADEKFIDCGDDSFIVEYRAPRGGELLGAITWNAPKYVVPYRRELEASLGAAATRPA
jgi:3-phenylpropionate/trans-cinnamate dioxygenase ferredoxin reductase subunit